MNRSATQLRGSTIRVSWLRILPRSFRKRLEVSNGGIAYDCSYADIGKALKPGDIVKDGMFTLFESVGALEVGLYELPKPETALTVADHGPEDGQWLRRPGGGIRGAVRCLKTTPSRGGSWDNRSASLL